MAPENFERCILHGLCCEWQRSALELKPSDRKGFLQPLFAIRDLKSKWGTWSPERREICLSADLVRYHSWDVIREVLLHEMAHQYRDQVLQARHEPPHGPSFHRACQLLRANPRASAGYSLLDERLAGDGWSGKGRIVAKVRKLMALAQSLNRFEAEAAMDKAHELMRNHQLDFITSSDRHELISTFAGRPALRHFREEYHLSNLLQDFYFVFGVWVPAYVLEKGKMGTVLEITGRTQNVKIARYVYDFVVRFTDFQWKEYTREERLSRSRKSDFAAGIIEGFRKRLGGQRDPEAEAVGTRSLVKVKDKELEREVAARYPRLRQIRGSYVKRDPKVLKDGMKLGGKLVLYQGIEEQGSVRSGKLLTQGMGA